MTPEFWQNFKQQTEQKWSNLDLNKAIFGFQIQPGTKWLDGYTAEEIEKITQVLGTPLPEDVVDLLKFTRGLDKPQLNLNPVDKTELQLWHLNLDYLNSEYQTDLKMLQQQGSMDTLQTMLGEPPHPIPIYAHRYIVANKEMNYKVYSVHETDIIVYGETLEAYLQHEFLNSAA